MSDLSAMLDRRRKGIQGKMNAAAGDPDSNRTSSTNPLDRLSQMIPPPKTGAGMAATGASKDDDWD